jgi:two-component system NtrC family sensor kinase
MNERILVVDDASDMRDFVITYVLKPWGYRTQEARDGLEALQIIRATPPDLILCDLNMPRLDGLGLLKELQAYDISIPVILMTFHGSEEIAIEVFRHGVKDYVIKPFTETELITAITHTLKEVRLVRERETLYQLGKFIASLPATDPLLNAILTAAIDLTGIPQGGILLLGQDGRSLINRALIENGRVRIVNQVVEHALARQAIQGGQPAFGQKQEEATGEVLLPFCVPLIAGQTSFGALALITPAEWATSEQLVLVETLADYAAIGLERARLAGVSRF